MHKVNLDAKVIRIRGWNSFILNLKHLFHQFLHNYVYNFYMVFLISILVRILTKDFFINFFKNIYFMASYFILPSIDWLFNKMSLKILISLEWTWRVWCARVYFWTYAHPSYCTSDLLARGFIAARWTSGRSAQPPSLS